MQVSEAGGSTHIQSKRRNEYTDGSSELSWNLSEMQAYYSRLCKFCSCGEAILQKESIEAGADLRL